MYEIEWPVSSRTILDTPLLIGDLKLTTLDLEGTRLGYTEKLLMMLVRDQTSILFKGALKVSNYLAVFNKAQPLAKLVLLH